MICVIILIHFVENLPSDVVIYLLKNVLKLIVSDHLWVVWNFYTFIVLLISFRLLEIFNLLIFLTDVLIIGFSTLSRISRIVSLIITHVFGVSKWLIIGTNVWVSRYDFLCPEINGFLSFWNHIYFNFCHLLIWTTVWEIFVWNWIYFVANIFNFVKISCEYQGSDLWRIHFLHLIKIIFKSNKVNYLYS